MKDRADAIRIKKELKLLQESIDNLTDRLRALSSDSKFIILHGFGFNYRLKENDYKKYKSMAFKPAEYFNEETLIDQLGFLSFMVEDGVKRARTPKDGISQDSRFMRREMLIMFTDYALHVNGCKILSERSRTFISWIYDLLRIVDQYCTENLVKSEIRNWVDKRDNDPDHGRTHCIQVWDQIGNQPITSYAPLIVERSCQEDFIE